MENASISILSHFVLFLAIVIIGALYSIFPLYDSRDGFRAMFGEYNEPSSLNDYSVHPVAIPVNFPGELSTDIDKVSSPLGNPFSPIVGSSGNDKLVDPDVEDTGNVAHKKGYTVSPLIGKNKYLDQASTWIDTVFESYTKILGHDKKQAVSHLKVVSNLTYTPTNTPPVQKKMIRHVIKSLLATINIYSETNLQLVNIDTMQVVHLSDGSVLYKVSFYTHEMTNKLSNKCAVEIYVEPRHVAHVQAIYTIPANLPHIPLDYKKYIDGVAIHLSPDTQVHPGELSQQVQTQLIGKHTIPSSPISTHKFDVNEYEKKLVRRPLIYSADPEVARKACQTAKSSWIRLGLF